MDILFKVVLTIFIAFMLIFGLFCFGQIDFNSYEFERPDIIGTFVANHNGIETLQVRDDQVWVRSYTEPEGHKYIDSGAWQIDSLFGDHKRLTLYDYFYRHEDWLDFFRFRGKHVRHSPDLDSAEIRYHDSLEAYYEGRPGIHSVLVHKEDASVRIVLNTDISSMSYRKIIDNT